MMATPKISIIVPVYGVEKYIEKCARSLFEQTMEELQFIFVDDCTTDKSIEILNNVLLEYPKRKDSCIIVRHENNKGASQSRFTGLSYANGEYIMFCDSDDYVELDFCSTLYTKAMYDCSDIVVCDFLGEYPSFTEYVSCQSSTNKIRLMESMLRLKTSWSNCNKLFKVSLFKNDILFPFSFCNMAEDMLLSFQLVYYCDRISYISEGLYHYVINDQSTTHSLAKGKMVDMAIQAIGNTDVLIDFFKEKGIIEQLRGALDYTKLHHRQLLFPLIKEKNYYNLWRKTYPDLNYKVFKMDLRVQDKIKFYLALLGLYKQ